MRSFLTIKLVVISILFSCTGPSRLEYALNFAGENRSELEKVLAYYSRQPQDTLKYQAACFLIENMPYHYYYDHEILDYFKADLCSLKHTVPEVTLGKDRVDPEVTTYLTHKYGTSFFTGLPVKNDAQAITADFLINNIEQAFYVWEKQPWGKYISFSRFCREILPYRTGNEPLQEWRTIFYATFQPVLDSLYTGDDPLKASQVIYDALVATPWTFISELDAPHLGGEFLLKERMGNCREYADIVVYALRALGIPCGTDIIIQNPDHCYKKHYWNYTRDSLGVLKEFELYEIRPEINSRNAERKRGKIYRQEFEPDKDHIALIYPEKEIYPSLKHPLLRDVSFEYFPAYSASVPLEKKYKKEEIIYLCVFNNSSWIPVGWASVKDGYAVFKDIEPDIYYMGAFYRNGTVFPVTDPFRINQEGKIIYATPDPVYTETVKLTRKFRIKPHLENIGELLIGGAFQGANMADFRDACTLYRITEQPEMRYYEIPLSSRDEYRYVRYVSPDHKHCAMAELEFYTEGNRELTGKVIAYEGEEDGKPLELQDAFFAFDKDVLTFFYSRGETDIWTGLDLGKPYPVTAIRFLVWNDDNFIREDNLYELFYFIKEKGAVSLGKQSGNKQQLLTYENVPRNALLWLHNHSGGREERIFLYENGHQSWW
ncbi:MAG: transglutaminase domain-containing protein [Candidatus Azobacteroides sp.]|nr:transglutaminase domain-containing protein [Candidatus Azobacteroides sp.]